MSDSLWLQGLKPPSLLCIQSPDKNTGVGWHALLQGIYQTQGLNLHLLWLLHCRWILYCWAINGSPEDVVGSLQVSVAQLFPTLCDPMDYSPPGSSFCGIFQARIWDWVAIPSNLCLPHCRQILYHLSHQGTPTQTKSVSICEVWKIEWRVY